MGCSSSNKFINLNPNERDYENNNYNNDEEEDENSINLYSESELNDEFNRFFNEEQIQDSFFNIETHDLAFENLKKREKEILIYFFNSTKNDFINKFNCKFNVNNIPNCSPLVEDFIKNENAEAPFQSKIEQCIEKIKKDKHQYEIKYLTVMLVGKSGVGKSTLINSLLKLEKNKAEVGTGNFQTTKLKAYQSKEVPFLRLVDTRGIELNVDYGAEAVKRDAENYINEQYKTNNPNNFIQCIWYCITGNRFEEVEIQLLNSLRLAYGENKIPIIIVYTQATDTNTINEMLNYIKEQNIKADFIQVLAERKKLVNNQYLEPSGLEDLVKETLKKCKNALKGDMFSVITRSMSEKIVDILKEQNDLDKKYIIKQMKFTTINNINFIRNKEKFIEFVMHLIGFNIIIFFERQEKFLNYKCKQIFSNSNFINNFLEPLIQQYENIAENTISQILEKKSIEFINLQVKVQKELNREINFNNQRNLEGFKKTSKNFLLENYYYLAQKSIIFFIFTYIYEKITDEFVIQLNNLIKQLIIKENNKKIIEKCYMVKYEEFSKRLYSYNYLFTETNTLNTFTNNYGI